MPTYEYECRKCGHHFEKFQRMTEARVKRCPECDGAVSRLLGAGAGIIFKGSGFYGTDYRSKSYSEAAKKDKSESGSTGGKKERSESSSSAKESGKVATKKQ